MASPNDPRDLLTDQYRNASNLNARIALHERFSTNRHGWQRWVFDHLALRPADRILELGCGPGTLWGQNLARIPPACTITLTDLSAGMVEEAQRNLVGRYPGLHFRVADAQAIPCDNGSFDLVIANHMLYHVPDIGKALTEIRRVLHPGGRLCATTVGLNHLAELTQLVRRFDPGNPYDTGSVSVRFGLENGAAVLAEQFERVVLHIYEDALIVSEAQPLVAYVASMMPVGAEFGAETFDRFLRFIQDEIATHGAIRINKAQGMFEATAPCAPPAR